MQLQELGKFTGAFDELKEAGDILEISQSSFQVIEDSFQNLSQEATIAKLATSGLSDELKNQISCMGEFEIAAEVFAEAPSAMAISAKGLGEAFVGLGATIKSTAVSIGAFLTASPVGWLVAAAAAIAVVVTLHDAFTVSLKEQLEMNEKLKESYNNTISELNSLKSETDILNKQINELLSKGDLSITEEEDLNRLILENGALENRITLLEETKRLQAQELNEGIEKAYAMEYGKETSYRLYQSTGTTRYNEVLGITEEVYEETTKTGTGEDYFNDQIVRAEKLQSLKRELTAGEKEELEGIRAYLLEQSTGLVEMTNGYEAVTASQKTMKANWEQMLSDSARVIQRYPDSAAGITAELKNRYAHGMDLADGSTYMRTSDSDKQTSQWIDSLSEEEQVLLITADIDETASLNSLQAYLDSVTGTEINSEDMQLYENLTEKAESYSRSVSSLVSSTSSLSSAFQEQEENGSLSLQTILQLTNAGYASALQFDESTGSCTLNKDAVIALIQAKILQQKIDLMDMQNNITEKLDTETDATYRLANGYLYLTQASVANQKVKLAEEQFNNATVQLQVLESLGKDLPKMFTKAFSASGKSVSSSVSKNVEDFTKMLDLELKALDAFTNHNLDNFKEHLDKRKAMIDSYHDSGKLTDAEYYSYMQKHYETELSYMDKVINAVQRRIDKEIEYHQDKIDSVKNQYESELKYLDTVKQSLQDQIDALQDANDEKERQVALEKAMYALERAQSQRTNKYYVAGRGMIYDTDNAAVSDARNEIENAKLEITIADIETAIEKVEDQQAALENQMDAEIESLNEIIENLENYKEQWGEVKTSVEQEQEDMLAAQFLGRDWEKAILNDRTVSLNQFKTDYEIIQQSIADAAWRSANEQIKAAQEAQKAASGTLGNAGTITTPSNQVSGGFDDSDVALTNPGYRSPSASKPTRYKVVNTRTNFTQSGFKSEAAAWQWANSIETKDTLAVIAYAKGGIVGSGNSSIYDGIARRLGEDHIIAARNGERVLTPIQNEMWENWTNALPGLLDLSALLSSQARLSESLSASASPVNREQVSPVNINIGDIRLENVQNPDDFARQIVAKFPSMVIQHMHKR